MSTISKCLLIAFGSGWGGRATKTWHAAAFLAEVDHEPDIRQDGRTSSDADESQSLAPITVMLSSRLMVLANLLKRGAILRYKRLAGLSSVEFGLVASLGRRPPMSVARLAEAVGQDKGQISRALAELVSRKLIAKSANPKDSREVLVSLTATASRRTMRSSPVRRSAIGVCANI